jgi:hypothetical protein
MSLKILRKFFVILIILIPALTVADCKKQPKCGCKGDPLFNITRQQATVYFSSESNITFTLLSDPYSQYNFCNPEEMFPKLADSKSGDILLVTGTAYWDCNFAFQASNSYYGGYGKVYQVVVTDVYADLYGKKK